MASTLSTTAGSESLRAALEEEIHLESNTALDLIAQRFEHLQTFIRRYAKLSQLSSPNGIFTDITSLAPFHHASEPRLKAHQTT